MRTILQQGAEAAIYLDKKQKLILKDRIKKSYRIPELDNRIRKQRTKSEIKLLEKASKIISAPLPKASKDINKIEMPFIQGKKLSESLDSFPLKEQKEICKKVGQEIAKLHASDLIHGDLTTSNMILTKDNEIFFIDFGLGYISKKIEDKAVDLHLLRQALEAKHFQNWETLLEHVLKAYEKTLGKEEAKKVFERIASIEKRGRYRH